MDLNQYQKRYHSQYGQDGVLEQIFKTIGTTNKYFVEFGSSGNDTGLGNTSYLRKSGFDGLLMDGNERPYGEDVNDRKYDVKIEFITQSNINELFDKYKVPNEFDLLSIDIDGQDFHVWNNLRNDFSPRVVSIEMNYHIPPGIDRVMYIDDNFIWKGDALCGSSVTALKQLGNSKGYRLVCTCMSDAIFVRRDLTVDADGNEVFKNMDNEFKLVELNTDIFDENQKFNQPPGWYDNPIFLESWFYLE
jgi:hypothetical protein